MAVQSSIIPKLKKVEEDQEHGIYTAEPLEESYGITLGNALRRVMLAALPGLAITAVKIKGIDHEFSTLEGMREDVLDFILNLKKIRVRKLDEFDKTVTLTIQAKGQGAIKAKDINCPSSVEIVNKDLYLATLTNKKSLLSAELIVEEGRGYSPSEERHYSKKKAIDLIPIDAIFSPMRKVNFSVEPTRVGQKTDFDKLTFDITTDGTITPMDALNLSAAILVEQFTLFVDDENYKPLTEFADLIVQEEEEGKKVKESSISLAGDLTIEDLGLSTRVLNSLHGANINTVAELIECSEEDLMKLRNFGQKSLNEIKEQLQERQLGLKESEES